MPDKNPRVIVLRCPRCRKEVTVPLSVETVLSQRVSYEVWLSAEVSVGGTSHRCPAEARDRAIDASAD